MMYLSLFTVLISHVACNELPGYYVGNDPPYINSGFQFDVSPSLPNNPIGFLTGFHVGVIYTHQDSPFYSPSNFASKHNDSYFFNVSFNALSNFIAFAAGTPNNYYYTSGWDSRRFSSWIEGITPLDIENIIKSIDVNAKKLIGPMFPYLKKSALEAIDSDTFAIIYEGSFLSNYRAPSLVSHALFERFSPKWIDTNAMGIIRLFEKNLKNDRSMELMKNTPIGFMSFLLKVPERCREIGPGLYSFFLRYSNFTNILESECMNNIPEHVLSRFNNPNVHKMPERIFESIYTPNLHKSNFMLMTKNQAQIFGNGLSPDIQCANLKLEFMNLEAISVLSPGCIQNWLSNYRKDILSLGNKWQILSNQVLSSIDEELSMNLAKKLDSKDYYYLADEQLNSLLKIEANLSLIPSIAFSRKRKNVSITAEMFSHFPPDTQVAILRNVEKLPDNLFENLELNHIERWIIQRGIYDWVGLDILMADLSIPNLGEMIKNLGVAHSTESSGSDNHPCASITSVDKFIRNKMLQENMTSVCARSLRVHFRESDYEKIAPRVKAMMPLEKLTELIKDWKTIDKEFFKLLVDSDFFCNEIPSDLFDELDPLILGLVNAKCFSKLVGKSNIKREVIRKFDQSCTSLVTSNDTIKLDDLTDEQFGQIGIATKDPLVSGALLIESQDISSATNTRIGSIKVWHLMKIEAFSGLKIEHLAVITPDSMAKWIRSQVHEIKDSVLSGLNAAQVKAIGTETEDVNKMTSLFTPSVTNQMSMEAKAALEERKTREEAKDSKSSSTSLFPRQDQTMALLTGLIIIAIIPILT